MKIYIISLSYNFALFFSIISGIEQKKFCWNNFYLLNYYCVNGHINKKTNKNFFTKKYYDSTTDELINYLNYIKNNIKNYPKIKKVFPSYNNAKTTKEILYRNMTLKELYSIDFLDDLNNTEVLRLYKKKLNIIKNLPINFDNNQEKYIQNTLDNLYDEVYTFPENNIEDNYIPNICNGKIDVIWTFVNSSENKWYKLFKKYKKKIPINRFREYDSLKYSMRSVYKYIKFSKDWFIVISDESQIPKFLNYKKINNSFILFNKNNLPEEKIKINFIFHENIFPNKSSLPNFNSNSIESTLSFIPNLSECFLYLNDDFFIANPIKPSFFIRKDGKLNLYKSNRISPHLSGSEWDREISYTNELLNKKFNFKRRLYPKHNCYFWRKSILLELNNVFKEAFSLTRLHRFRGKYDVVLPFLHSAYSLEKKYGVEILGNSDWFRYYVLKKNKYVNKIFTNIKNNKDLKCFCINDGVKDQSKQGFIFLKFLENIENLFPEKMPFEK